MNENQFEKSMQTIKNYIDTTTGGSASGDINLDDYALKTDIPTRVSQLLNDSNFLTSIPEEYVTDDELTARGYLTEHQSLEAYALKTDLHTHSNKAVLDGISNTNVSNWNSAYTHSQSTHFSGSYNDLSNKPTIPTIPDSLPANGGNADTIDNFHIWSGTQAQFDAIVTKDANTIYLVKEG